MAVTPSTSQMRYSGRGPFKTLNCKTPASVMINTGDLLWSNSGVATPANAFVWDTNLATTQPEFRLKFLGVANEDKSALDASTRAINIIVDGIFEYPCAALGGAQHIGDFVAAAKDANNNSLADQILAICATYDLSIGVLFDEAATGDTLLRVYIQSYLAISKAQKT